jgi:hypothetical protein
MLVFSFWFTLLIEILPHGDTIRIPNSHKLVVAHIFAHHLPKALAAVFESLNLFILYSFKLFFPTITPMQKPHGSLWDLQGSAGLSRTSNCPAAADFTPLGIEI